MKKPLILALVLAMSLSLLASCADVPTVKAATPKENQIAYPQEYDTTISGASSYNHSGDHADSPYFAHPDVYNLENTENLTVLNRFKTYQQTTEYSCGNAAALMVLTHYGVTDQKELDIAKVMISHCDIDGDNTEEPGVANEEGEYGTSTTGMVQLFKELDWNVSSSLDATSEDGSSFTDTAEFTKWIISNLKDNTPVMVEWIDWAGHWQTVIGYDTMGTESFGDDVLIMADSYDTSDHLQDGYYIVPAERFYYMWFDSHILPKDQKLQQWIIATPKE